MTKPKISKKNTHTDSPRRSTQTRMPTKQTFQYCGSSHAPRQCLAYGKMCMECSKIDHFRAVCRSRRTRAMNKVEQETPKDNTRDGIESVGINSIQFNKNHSVLTTNLKMSAVKNNIMVSYKIDTGSDSNIIPLHMYKTQLGMCTVIIEHRKNKKKYRFL